MAFDWKAFAAGFMDDQAQQIQKRREKADDYKTKLEEEYEASKVNYQKRRQFVTTAMSQVNMLRAYGASDEQIKAAVASGPETLFSFANQLSEQAAKTGKKTYSRTEIDAMINMPAGFDGGEMSVNEFLKRSYGLVEPSVGSTKAPERGFWEKALGMNLKGEVRASLDREARMDGYSAMDINEIARQDAYTSLVPGAYFTFTPGVEYDPVDIATRWTTLRQARIDDVIDSPQYKSLFDNPEAQQELLSSAVVPLAGAFAKKYGQKWLNDPVMDVKRIIGEKAFTALTIDEGDPTGIVGIMGENLTAETGTGETVRAGDFKFTFDINGNPIYGSYKGQPIPAEHLAESLEDAYRKGYVATIPLPTPIEMTTRDMVAPSRGRTPTPISDDRIKKDFLAALKVSSYTAKTSRGKDRGAATVESPEEIVKKWRQYATSRGARPEFIEQVEQELMGQEATTVITRQSGR